VEALSPRPDASLPAESLSDEDLRELIVPPER